MSQPPRQRLTDVSSRLRGFVITTYDVAPGSLASFLPPSLSPEVFPLAGGERALVSAVSFLNTSFHVGFAPFVRLTCAQTNYRAYVRRAGQRCVWFFATALDSVFVVLPRYVWQLPWHRARVRQEVDFDGERLRSYDWHARAVGAEERLVLEGTGAPLEALAGLGGAAETLEILTHPLIGFVRRRDGAIAKYGVWHEHLRMEVARPREARHELFEGLGLVRPGQEPHSVLVQRETHFLVLLPPKRVEPPPHGHRPRDGGRAATGLLHRCSCR